ncbi:MAG: CYTH domain-containing protein [Deltaproteobacteria bacterium]|nr:CYTH domain-containing protein [Deltaproteobacteria bacterium]MBW2418037.1 CYTH domain-containing protein [Deltaproteobacteria bacterium]
MSGATGQGGESRERELKLGVPGREVFEALIEAAGGRREPPVLQVNHFFDTAGRALRELEIGFRVREEGESFFVTVKGPTAGGGGAMLADRVELERELAPEPARVVLAGEGSPLELLEELEAGDPEASRLLAAVRKTCTGVPLAEIGAFENERTRVRTVLAAADVVLEFDRTCFEADELRYEVELELGPGQSAGELGRALEALFAEVGAGPVPTTGKLTRFLELLDGRVAPAG